MKLFQRLLAAKLIHFNRISNIMKPHLLFFLILNLYLIYPKDEVERGNLYHSLYDLKNDKLLINNESPGTSCNANNKEEMNKWIKENLHDKIEKIITE